MHKALGLISSTTKQQSWSIDTSYNSVGDIWIYIYVVFIPPESSGGYSTPYHIHFVCTCPSPKGTINVEGGEEGGGRREGGEREEEGREGDRPCSMVMGVLPSQAFLHLPKP